MGDAPVHKVRDGHNRFTATVDAAEKRAHAARLRAMGWSYERIAKEVGYACRGSAYNAVKQVLEETVREAGDELRQLERERLDRMSEAAWEVLERQHVVVSNGRVVDLNGAPLPDDAPVLQAIDRLLRISESRRKLVGLDAPSKVSVEADQIGSEIAQILDRIAQRPDDDGTP
ncbi:hypothetical protein ACFWTC_03175 [Streptomyces sp. NPDC058619]|uniref:hypothetical protein n=1 Tax=Streptomyces sp. NPDC058619 TaxID=3346559 RepID=UPI00366A16B2